MVKFCLDSRSGHLGLGNALLQRCAGSVATRVLFYCVVGFVLPHCLTDFDNIMRVVAGVYFVCVFVSF
jgi:hypothetical protein